MVDNPNRPILKEQQRYVLPDESVITPRKSRTALWLGAFMFFGLCFWALAALGATQVINYLNR